MKRWRLIALVLALLLAGCRDGVVLRKNTGGEPTAETVEEPSPTPAQEPEPSSVWQMITALRRPTPDMFGIAPGAHAALYDAALDYIWARSDPHDLIFPGVTVYGTYDDDDGTVYICNMHHYFIYDFGTPNYNGNIGGGGTGAAIKVTQEQGAFRAMILYVMGDGGDPDVSLRRLCGPRSDLAEEMIAGTAQGTPLCATQDVNELLQLYCEATDQMHLLDWRVAPPVPFVHAFVTGDALNREAILAAYAQDKDGTAREMAQLYVDIIKGGAPIIVVDWGEGYWAEEEARKTKAFDLLFDRQTLQVARPWRWKTRERPISASFPAPVRRARSVCRCASILRQMTPPHFSTARCRSSPNRALT